MHRIVQLYKEFTSLEGILFIYSLSFSLLLALAPSLIIFVMLFDFAYLSDEVIQSIITFIEQMIPQELIGGFIEFLGAQNFNLIPSIITLCASFWLASRSVYSFMLISANHEEVDVPKWAIRLRAIYLFVVLAILIVAAIIIGSIMKEYLPLVSSIMMFILFTLMYRALSFRKRNLSFGILGGLFCTIAILCVSALFLTIVGRFTSYETVYGPLSSLVTLLLAIYIISGIIYFGFCLNIVFEDTYQQEHLLEMKSQKYYAFCMNIQNKLKKLGKKKDQYKEEEVL
ncbi:MAG: YihY/virulence factor BrkB family protein [Erysipelotrichaceae bacterium]|nr:YihY/virulence factor BrkB family protein [Erysipelotrichaceae bacterium]